MNWIMTYRDVNYYHNDFSILYFSGDGINRCNNYDIFIHHIIPMIPVWEKVFPII
jgi:hypothetical protein